MRNILLSPIKRFSLTVIFLWFIAAGIAGWFGLFLQQNPVNIGLFITIPILFFISLYIYNARFRTFTQNIPLSFLVSLHISRYVGFVFLTAWLFGKLPAAFALPAGIGDIIAAFFALPLALAIRKRKPVRTWFMVWNIFGLIDLISAISLGILYANGPFGVLRTGLSTTFITEFPVNMIPTFIVPLLILLHFLALLRRNEIKA